MVFSPTQAVVKEKSAVGCGLKVTFKVSSSGIHPKLAVEVSIKSIFPADTSAAEGAYIVERKAVPGLNNPVPVDDQIPVGLVPDIAPFNCMNSFEQKSWSKPAVTEGGFTKVILRVSCSIGHIPDTVSKTISI